MSEVTVKVGDWVLFREGSAYQPIEVRMKQATKATGKIVKFDDQWPKQTHVLSVVAAFADQAVATSALERINGGVAGEYERSRRSAEDERSRRAGFHRICGTACAQPGGMVARGARLASRSRHRRDDRCGIPRAGRCGAS